LLVDAAKAMPGLISLIPKEEYKLIDQLRRAMHSSLANLAEGNGRFSTKERNKFFNYSMGSISELEAGIDYSYASNYINLSFSNELKDTLRKAYYMIRKLKK
jgi:four helix bundle protein